MRNSTKRTLLSAATGAAILCAAAMVLLPVAAISGQPAAAPAVFHPIILSAR